MSGVFSLLGSSDLTLFDRIFFASVLGGRGSFDEISICPLKRKDRKQNVKVNLNARPQKSDTEKEP